MTLSNRPLLPAGEREDECGPKLIRSWLSKPSWDPETETTASCRDFWKKQIIHPALLRGRERCTYPIPKQFPLSLDRPSRGLLLLCLPPVDGGQDGRGGLPTPSSTAPLLEAAADAVREQGWMQGAALGDEQAGRCNRRTGGGSSCPPRAGSVRSPQSAPVQPGTAGPGYRLRRRRGQSGIQEPWGTDFVGVPMSTRHSQRWRSWTTSVDIARPRDRAITFVARGARSGAVRSSSQNFRIITTPVHVPQCF